MACASARTYWRHSAISASDTPAAVKHSGQRASTAITRFISKNEACIEINRVMAVLARWPECFTAAGVSEADIALCRQYVRADAQAIHLLTAEPAEHPMSNQRKSLCARM